MKDPSSHVQAELPLRVFSLSPRQQRFCEEYVVDLNGKQAAIRAGYSISYAHRSIPVLMNRPGVKDCIQELMNERSQRVEITADTVLRELLLIARADIGQAFDSHGALRPVHEMPEEVRRAISGIEIREESGREEGGDAPGFTKKIRFWEKTKALDLLGRHLRLFADRLEVTGRDGAALIPAAELSPEQIAQVERIRSRREAITVDVMPISREEN